MDVVEVLTESSLIALYVWQHNLDCLSCCIIQKTMIENFLHAANVTVDGVELVMLVTDTQEHDPGNPQTPKKALTVNSMTGLVYFDDYMEDILNSKMVVNVARKYFVFYLRLLHKHKQKSYIQTTCYFDLYVSQMSIIHRSIFFKANINTTLVIQ